jgi:hypothetical protein
MESELISEALVLNSTLTRLIAEEDLVTLIRREISSHFYCPFSLK